MLALDGDVTGSAANVKLATAIAAMGREAAIFTWPPGEDPASWLEKRGTAGLAALTRKRCLEAPADQLRPRHSGDQVAKSHIGNTHGGLEARWRAALAPAERMREKPAERYATAAVETLAPVVVTAAIEACADNAGRLNDVRSSEPTPTSGCFAVSVGECWRRSLTPGPGVGLGEWCSPRRSTSRRWRGAL